MTGLRGYDICFSRGFKNILTQLSFSLSQGDILRIKGPNGIGKSTLLKILAGQLTSFTGSIQLNDTKMTISDAILVDHKMPLNPNLTVFDNVAFWLKTSGLPLAEMQPALASMDLNQVAHIPLRHLSQGWKKRVQLSLLHLNQARLWLLDEPVEGLDDIAQDLLMQAMTNHTAQGGMVIYASHIPLNMIAQKDLDLERNHRGQQQCA